MLLNNMSALIRKLVVECLSFMYYSHELISSIKKKDNLRRKIKEEDCPLTKAKLKTKISNLRKSVKTGIKACFDNYEIRNASLL